MKDALGALLFLLAVMAIAAAAPVAGALLGVIAGPAIALIIIYFGFRLWRESKQEEENQ